MKPTTSKSRKAGFSRQIRSSGMWQAIARSRWAPIRALEIELPATLGTHSQIIFRSGSTTLTRSSSGKPSIPAVTFSLLRTVNGVPGPRLESELCS